jgi:hypothetical protein
MSEIYLRPNAASGYTKMVTDAASEVRWSFTFDNLENPTQYVSERAVRLRLPVCPENNKFFGQFLRLDSVIMPGGYSPTEKMQYVAMDGGDVVSTGTAVIDTIDRQYYNLSLVGSQATLFRKLMNAGYDTAKAAEDSTYYLMTDWLKYRKMGQMVIEGQTNLLNRFQVLASWIVDNPILDFSALRSTADLRSAYGITDANITETMAFIASLVGFAPTAQGRYKEFESDMWLENPDWERTSGFYMYLPVLTSDVDMSTLEPTPKVVKVEDGVVEAQMGEYRSYYQQPFVYIKALWEMLAHEFQSITGYTLTLDDRWYNNVGKLVYMLPPNDVEEKHLSDVTIASVSDDTTLPDLERNFDGSGLTLTTGNTSVVAHKVNDYEMQLDIGIDFPGLGQEVYAGLERPIEIDMYVGNRLTGDLYTAFPLPADGVFSESDVKGSTIGQAIMTEAQMNMREVIFPVYYPREDRLSLSIRLPLRSVPEYDTSTPITVSFSWYRNSTHPFILRNSQTAYTARITMSASFGGKNLISTNNRSESVVTLERLFGSVNPFQILLQFSKQRHLLWLVDDAANSVSVVSAKDYFDDIGDASVDLTDAADTNDLEVSPLSWAEKAVVFNLEDMDGDGVKGYKDRHGVSYGSVKVVTENNLSKEIKDLFDNPASGSAMFSETVAPCASLFGGVCNFYVETLPMPLNILDGEAAGIHGNFYYRHNNTTISGELLARWNEDPAGQFVRVTDDCPTEVYLGRYTWHGLHIHDDLHVEEICREFPVFSTCSAANGDSVLFGPVREVYTSQPDTPTNFLYEQHWKNYIEEVYNPENKTITCKVFFTRRLLAAVRKNPIVRIGSLLYMLMSIDGWSSHTPLCRCKLRQINDLKKLQS